MSNAFGGPRVQVKPPERGVFALDHEGECKKEMLVYLNCLREKEGNLFALIYTKITNAFVGHHFDCRQLSGKYLKCRMDRDLMAKEDLEHLGLGEVESCFVRSDYKGTKKKEGKSKTYSDL